MRLGEVTAKQLYCYSHLEFKGKQASQRPPSRQAEKGLGSQGLGWGHCLALGKVPSEPGPKLRPRPGAEERCQGGEKKPGGKVKVGPPLSSSSLASASSLEENPQGFFRIATAQVPSDPGVMGCRAQMSEQRLLLLPFRVVPVTLRRLLFPVSLVKSK